MQNQTPGRSKSNSIITLLGIAGAGLLMLVAAFFHPVSSVQAAATADHPAAGELNAVTDVMAATSAATDTALITPTYWIPPDPAYKVFVEKDGFFRLTYADLQNAGLPVDTLDPATLQMFYMGREIAIVVEGESDGRFDANDSVIFYGRSVDSLYYEGSLPDHKYTGTNVYWLAYGNANGLRMAPRNSVNGGTPVPAIQSTEHQEFQKRYVSEYPRYSDGPRFHFGDDHWFGYFIQVTAPPGSNMGYPLYLDTPNLATGAYSLTMAAHVVGGYANDHGVRLWVNQYRNPNAIYENTADWTDFESFIAVGQAPQSYLNNGLNILNVEFLVVEGNYTENYLDWIELTYYREPLADGNRLAFPGETGTGPWRYTVGNFTNADIRVYDVTDLFANQQIVDPAISGAGPYAVEFGDNESGRRYVTVAADAYLSPTGIEQVTHQTSEYTPSRVMVVHNGVGVYSLLDGQNAADWIAIAPRAFWDEIMPLLKHRANRKRVALVDVQEIYDQFNGGLMSAESIHNFLKYAYANWAGDAPEFVLLVGGGTNDMRNYLGNSKPTYIPPYLVPVDPTLGETASDNRFVTFIGDDILPDMSIGRFPTYSESDVTTMVNKTIHYEETPTLNDWNTRVLMVADDQEGSGGNFHAFSDDLIYGSDDPAQPESTRFLPEPYTATKVYLAQNCDDVDISPAYECRGMINDTVNNEGALLVSYVGHAQIRNWASEKLLDQAMASSFTNYDKLSIFLSMACFEGFFFEPANGSFSLAETYLTNPNGGAVASWSPTGFGLASGHDWMEKGFFLELFQHDETVFGRAMTKAKYYLDEKAGAQFEDLLDTFILFGDPALQIQSFAMPTAVNVADLAAARNDADVTVSWSTTNEVDILGFDVWRSESPNGEFIKLNQEPIWAKTSGGATGADYAFQDMTATPEQAYWYRLRVLLQDGDQADAGLVELTEAATDSQIFLPIVTK
jgi:hypothetical protein